MKSVRFLLAFAALAAAVVAPAARAEVWAYVDDKGVAHFAADKRDARYELYFRGGEGAEAPAAPATPRAVHVPTAQSKLIAYFEVAPGYKQVQHHVRQASKDQNIDADLLKALIATESGFDARAVSPKGAIGLMQIMPATAERYGVTSDRKTTVEKKLADPRINISTGARYLRYLIDMFPGKLELALAAYNAGEGAVQRAGNKVPNYPETRNYVRTVMQLYEMLRPPSILRAANMKGNIDGHANGRLRVEFASGASAGRGNMPSFFPLTGATALPQPEGEVAEPVAAAAPDGPTRQ